jgi:hypothetical protein
MLTRLVEKLLGFWMTIQSFRPARPRPEDFHRQQWGDSTQRLGVRLSERIRDHFRRFWFRVAAAGRTHRRAGT